MANVRGNQLLKINNDIIIGFFIEPDDPNTLVIQTRSKSVYRISMGQEGTSGLDNFMGTSPPTSTNDSIEGYSVGSRWLDATNDVLWFCINATASSAIWIIETQYGFQSLTDLATIVYNTNLGPKAVIVSPGGNRIVNLTNLPPGISREGYLNIENTNGITVQFQVAGATTNIYIAQNGQGDTPQSTTAGATARDSFAWVWDGTDLWVTYLPNFTQT